MPIFKLSKEPVFPPPNLAEDGLLAIGGDLSRKRLLAAYRVGVFPWYSEGDPILWWAPDPRMIYFPGRAHVSRRLLRSMRQRPYQITLDRDFPAVIRACAQTPRKHEAGTWITADIEAAYIDLHDAGFAHSIEAWHEGELVGGLYGVSLGACFFGESMFARERDASKIAFTTLAEHFLAAGGAFIDCQVSNPHLVRLGAREIARWRFMPMLEVGLQQSISPQCWDPSCFPLTYPFPSSLKPTRG